MNKSDPKTFVSAFNAGHPGVTISINQAGVAESFAHFVGDANLHEHHVVMGETRDGMSAGPIFPQVLDLTDKPKQ